MGWEPVDLSTVKPLDAVKIPVALILDRELRPGARVLYMQLASIPAFSGDWFVGPTMPEIAETLGASVTSTRAYVAELRARGWIDTMRVQRQQPMRYRVRLERRS